MSTVLFPKDASTTQLESRWFIDAALSELTFTAPSLWRFTFASGVWIQVECLWRLLDASHIILTSEDHQQKFGLPVPVDAISEATRILAEQRVVEFSVRQETLDVLFRFSGGHRLEILPTSSGYEGWDLCAGHSHFVAVGRGRLVRYDEKT